MDIQGMGAKCKKIFIKGSFTDWEEREEFRMNRINSNGDWEINLASGSS